MVSNLPVSCRDFSFPLQWYQGTRKHRLKQQVLLQENTESYQLVHSEDILSSCSRSEEFPRQSEEFQVVPLLGPEEGTHRKELSNHSRNDITTVEKSEGSRTLYQDQREGLCHFHPTQAVLLLVCALLEIEELEIGLTISRSLFLGKDILIPLKNVLFVISD
jgi:hypothetical protein